MQVLLASFCTGSNDSLIITAGGGQTYPFLPSDAVQIYNPLTDTWTLEAPLPHAIVCNSAAFIPPNKVISAGGWTSQMVYTDTTWIGTGFPSGPSSVSSHLTVNLVPFVQPIQIPATGGAFDFYAFVNNSASFSQEVELWTMEIAPGGSIIGPILGPATVDMEPGTRGWYRHQNVPGTAAPGLYTYIAYAGDYPTGNIWATDSLQFTKLTTGDGPRVSDWSCTGEEISPDVGAQHAVAVSGSGATPTIEVLPNPFNPSTAISYKLQAASHVNLRIYDTAGRLVTELVNGWRDVGAHEVTFDGSALASGIYVYRLEAGQYAASGKMVLMK